MKAVPGTAANVDMRDTVDADWREVQAQIDAVVHELDPPRDLERRGDTAEPPDR